MIHTSMFSLLTGWVSLADNVELGTACGKLHRVSVLAITDAGERCPLASIFCFCAWLPVESD